MNACSRRRTKSIHTAALEAILYNPYVNAFGHLGNPNFDFDHEYIISRCNERGKVVEINNASLNVRAGSKQNCADIARMCMKYEVPIVVDSDSHICYRVGPRRGCARNARRNRLPGGAYHQQQHGTSGRVLQEPR